MQLGGLFPSWMIWWRSWGCNRSLPKRASAREVNGTSKSSTLSWSRIKNAPKSRDRSRSVSTITSPALSLPESATIYDRILISLRATDAVFTFNWDPFLFDAYLRNRSAVPLPEIFFLHGNVRIGACRDHDRWGARNGRCPDCGGMFADVPLLYPIQRKNYSDAPYIRRNWAAAKIQFKAAFTVTIFGYGAPASDRDAFDLLRLAWLARSSRSFEHIEIIDTAPAALLEERWSSFTPTRHYRIVSRFEQSRIARWPRRSGESTFYPMSRGVPCEDFPPPNTDRLPELLAYVADIARHEKRL